MGFEQDEKTFEKKNLFLWYISDIINLAAKKKFYPNEY